VSLRRRSYPRAVAYATVAFARDYSTGNCVAPGRYRVIARTSSGAASLETARRSNAGRDDYPCRDNICMVGPSAAHRFVRTMRVVGNKSSKRSRDERRRVVRSACGRAPFHIFASIAPPIIHARRAKETHSWVITAPRRNAAAPSELQGTEFRTKGAGCSASHRFVETEK
jgi:hypothetical protein